MCIRDSYNSSLFIGLDSGAYNLSALIGTPSYAIMGASPPLKHLSAYKAIIPPTGVKSNRPNCSGLNDSFKIFI